MRTPSFPLRSAFLALPLHGEALEVFVAAQHSLEPFADCLRFQPPATAHLTLVFWRELLEIEWQPMLSKAHDIAVATAPFDVPIRGWGTFGAPGAERVLFLTPVFSPELATLKKRCPWPQAQPFHPHITLARMTHAGRFDHARKAIAKVLDGVSCVLHSHLLRLYANINEAAQTPLQDFPFG